VIQFNNLNADNKKNVSYTHADFVLACCHPENKPTRHKTCNLLACIMPYTNLVCAFNKRLKEELTEQLKKDFNTRKEYE